MQKNRLCLCSAHLNTWKRHKPPPKQRAEPCYCLCGCSTKLWYWPCGFVMGGCKLSTCKRSLTHSFKKENFVAWGEWLTQGLPLFDVDTDHRRSTHLHLSDLLKTFLWFHMGFTVASDIKDKSLLHNRRDEDCYNLKVRWNVKQRVSLLLVCWAMG